MIADIALFLVVSSIGLLAGMQLHESAHYLVLKVADRSPTMYLPSIADGRISARVEFDLPDDQIPADIRLAAVAPLLAGLLVAAVLAVALMVLAGTVGTGLLWLLAVQFFVCLAVRTGYLSRQDREIARGRVSTG